MNFIFEKDKELGIYPIKCFNIAWYDVNNSCFDETILDPDNFTKYDFAYISANDEEKLNNKEYCKVYAYTVDGRVYELKFDRVK